MAGYLASVDFIPVSFHLLLVLGFVMTTLVVVAERLRPRRRKWWALAGLPLLMGPWLAAQVGGRCLFVVNVPLEFWLMVTMEFGIALPALACLPDLSAFRRKPRQFAAAAPTPSANAHAPTPTLAERRGTWLAAYGVALAVWIGGHVFHQWLELYDDFESADARQSLNLLDKVTGWYHGKLEAGLTAREFKELATGQLQPFQIEFFDMLEGDTYLDGNWTLADFELVEYDQVHSSWTWRLHRPPRDEPYCRPKSWTLERPDGTSSPILTTDY